MAISSRAHFRSSRPRSPRWLRRARGATADWRSALFLAMVASAFLLGGASHAAALAQPIVRASAFAALIALALAGGIDWRGHRFVAAMLTAAVILALLQLIPLPPAMWTRLPGRGPFLEIGMLTGASQPWRPLSLVPDATINALFSLVVPVAFFACHAAMPPARRALAVPAFLIGIAVSAMVALFQLADAGLDNPLLNETPGIASGLMANRNHQAVLLTVGILLVPAWLAARERRSLGRWLAAVLLLFWFALMILAAGSRAGLAFGAGALFAVARPLYVLLDRSAVRAPRRLLIVAFAGVVGVALLVGFAVFSGHDRAVQRLFAREEVSDLRVRALPTVWSMTSEYFPAGSGFGGFDPLFRMHEPVALLKPTFFNHAHDDVLEIAIDGGVAGVALMLAAVVWWAARGRALLRSLRPGRTGWPGFVALFFLFAASLIDYPLRTPLFMVLLVQAALWLHGADAAEPEGGGRALRSEV